MKFKPQFAVIPLLLMMVAGSAMATSFVVPTDEEMVSKSAAIAVGTIEGSFVQENDGTIETLYELRVERGIKGAVRPNQLLRIASLGGVLEDGERGLIVPASAHFEQGERVLVFLSRDDKGRWRTTDLTLGRFEFVTSTKGERLLVRAMEDVVGWDHAGRVHHEKVRRAEGFLRFVEETVRGRAAAQDYSIDASEVTLEPEPEPATRPGQIAVNAPFPASTYTDFVNNQPVRWPNMTAGVPFYKRSDQNISGAADGGVAAIQSGLAAWNNECGSLINLQYAGQVAKASQNHDATNVVEYNDPQSRISGSWTGSGTVGITFLSFAGSHTFNGQSWLNITDADVVFQNGYPATNASFAAAMTHELGHGIGFRHSNQNHATGGACNPAVEECTSAAIMNSSVSANYGYVLQPYDVNAAQSVYPGGVCSPVCTPPSITSQPTSRSISAGSSTTLSVGATGTAPLTYQWYTGAPGNTSSPVPGGTGPSITVTPASTTSYWVRVLNNCGAANSAAATVTVTTTAPTGSRTRYDFDGDGRADIFWWHDDGSTAVWLMGGLTRTAGSFVELVPLQWQVAGVGDFSGDGRADVLLRTAGGQNSMWFMNGTAKASGVLIEGAPGNWVVASVADFSGDGRADIFWRDPATGANAIWLMNGATKTSGVVLESAEPGWTVAGSGDFNGDGRADVLWRHTNGNNAIWLMNGTTKASGALIDWTPVGWHIGGVGDFNADGRADIFWRHADGSNAIWVMNGFTHVSSTGLEFAGNNWLLVEVSDFDGDGDADVLWRDDNAGQNAMWLMQNTTKAVGAIIDPTPRGWHVRVGR